MRSISEVVAILEEERGWERLFREIKILAAQYDYTYKVAQMKENRDKNRYRDVSPFDHSRVKLVNGTSDYINSSLVEMEKANRKYILTQGPLPNTSGEFWQMVWEQNSKAVIMLNKVIEKGNIKCNQYWPLELSKPKVYSDEGFKVTVLKETDKRNFLIRELELCNIYSNDKRTVIQFHYVAWPDFGVPESPTTFLNFLDCVRSYQVLENIHGPAVIHCSAGIGRSGTFALVDTCFVYLEKNIEFDIRQTLLEMRKFRMGLIQTAQQLRFSCLAIEECERKLQDKMSEKNNAEESESDDNDSEPPPPPPDGDHKTGDTPDKPESDNPESQDRREGRKRHGEPNGPHDEKRERIDNNQSAFKRLGCNPSTTINENNNIVEKKQQRQNERISDKNAALRKKVEKIKEKMKAKEKKWPWKRYLVGGIVASVVVGFAIRYWFRN